GPAILVEPLRELLRRLVGAAQQRGVEPLVAVELALTASLDEPVGVEHDRRARIEPDPSLLVALSAFDPECEPRDRQRRGNPDGRDEPRGRMAGGGTGELARL